MELKHTRLGRDGTIERCFRTKVQRLDDGWWLLVGKVDPVTDATTLVTAECKGPFATKDEAERVQLALVKAQTTGPGVKTRANTPAGAALLRRARAVPPRAGGHTGGRRSRGR